MDNIHLFTFIFPLDNDFFIDLAIVFTISIIIFIVGYILKYQGVFEIIYIRVVYGITIGIASLLILNNLSNPILLGAFIGSVSGILTISSGNLSRFIFLMIVVFTNFNILTKMGFIGIMSVLIFYWIVSMVGRDIYMSITKKIYYKYINNITTNKNNPLLKCLYVLKWYDSHNKKLSNYLYNEIEKMTLNKS